MNGRMQSAPGSAIGGARGRMRGRRASSSATSAAPSASASPLGSKATRTPAPATTTGRPSAAAPNAPKHTHLVLYLSISLGSQQYAILKSMHAVPMFPDNLTIAFFDRTCQREEETNHLPIDETCTIKSSISFSIRFCACRCSELRNHFIAVFLSFGPWTYSMFLDVVASGDRLDTNQKTE
jgi:hypothetical protein